MALKFSISRNSPFAVARVAIAGAALIAMSGIAGADDALGCRDPEGIKRFEGSKLVLCDNRKFDEYEVGTGKLIDNEDYTGMIFETKMDVEGKVEKNLYVVPKGPSEAEVFRNYDDLLTSLGYGALFKAGGEDAGRALDYRMSKTFKGMDAMMSFHAEGQRFGTYVKKASGLETYIVLYVVMGEAGSNPYIEVTEGQVMARIDVIYAGKMKDQMVLVKASDMKKAIDELGRISLYGINFDFNKSDIKPESRPVLDEIGKFLKDYPEQKLTIVGHTDGVGGADFNMKLSKDRAVSVAGDLTKTYGIAAGRLVADGKGMSAPVASNDTDDGRAKNRRVELVKLD